MIRVRFAPSPTGPLHIGSIRTILYNYLLAKKYKGSFILRVEDTDQKRFVPSAEAYILESLHWLGIIPDEGPEQGGSFGPYNQSKRITIYKKYIQRLLENGYVYYAFDTPEEIDIMRKKFIKDNKIVNTQYNSISRKYMRNGLTMSLEQVEESIALGKPYVIRLKIIPKMSIRFEDGIRGWVKVDTSVLDDKVLIRSDGSPTYHFASVIDDYLMKITHVIRGEEWLPSTPIHILLYRYLGWTDQIPKFIHLPILLAPNGSGKLSKRHTNKYEFPVFPITWNSPDLKVENAFRELGYLPDALLNFLSLMGWNPGTNQEIFTKEELIENFSIKRLGKSVTQFNFSKAKWFNQQHIKKKGEIVWASYFIEEAAKENIVCSQKEAILICNLVQDRITFPKDFWKEGRFLFFDPVIYEHNIIKKKWNSKTKEKMITFLKGISNLVNWHPDEIKELFKNLSITDIMPLIRIALTGSIIGPDLIKIVFLLGRDKIFKRINFFLEKVA